MAGTYQAGKKEAAPSPERAVPCRAYQYKRDVAKQKEVAHDAWRRGDTWHEDRDA